MPQPRNTSGENFEWNGKSYAKVVEKHFEKNLDRAALFLVTVIKNSMEGSAITGTLSGATRKARTNAARRREGKPPRVQTGRLRSSITFARPKSFGFGKRLVRSVGAGVGKGSGIFSRKGYAFFLEFKRGKGSRPWLRPALNNNLAALNKHLTRPMTGPSEV